MNIGALKRWPIKLTKIETEESLKAAKAVDGQWVAVDFIPSADRVKEPPFVIEVNSSPGTEGIEEATKRNLSKEIVQYFEDRDNWKKVPSMCGYKEVVHIHPFGRIVGKFDTGNSGNSEYQLSRSSLLTSIGPKSGSGKYR